MIVAFLLDKNRKNKKGKKQMIRRYISPELINALKKSQVWINLSSDSELQPEIRNNAVSIYYRSGAFLRNLRIESGALTADIHQKFIPLDESASGTYARLTSCDGVGLGFELSPKPISLGTAETCARRAYKERIAQVQSSPECQVVQAICERPENQVLDQEIAFQEPGESRDKIDLCYYEANISKLVFVEVKQVDDSRLFSRANGSRPEVIDQLQSYSLRLKKHKKLILETYTQVASLKRELGLGQRVSDVPKEGIQELLESPVLIIGNCSASQVQDILNSKERWQPLMQGIRSSAAALILCGSDGCRLSITKGRQTIVF
jgi:hypothetical protein